MLQDLSRTIARMAGMLLVLARERPRELALGVALGAAALVLFGYVYGFLRRRAASTARPPFPALAPHEEAATPVPRAAQVLRESAGELLLIAAISFVLLGFGVLAALDLQFGRRQPGLLHWNTVAYFSMASFFWLAFLFGLLGLARKWSLWLWFAGCDRVPAQAVVRYLGERTYESGEGFETYEALHYTYRALSPEGRERTFVAEESVGARERRRLTDTGELPVEYARDRPGCVRRG